VIKRYKKYLKFWNVILCPFDYLISKTYLAFKSFDIELKAYPRNVSCALPFYCYHWVDTSAGRLLVPEGIIHPVVSTSAPTCFISSNLSSKFTIPKSCNYYANQGSPSSICELIRFWLSCLGPFVFCLASKDFLKVFGLQIYRFWTYMVNLITEMRRAH